MNMHVKVPRTVGRENVVSIGPTKSEIRDAARRATVRIAPLWPLRHYVAVNPFLGLANLSFSVAATRLAHVSGARMTMPRAWYQRALDDQRVTDADLAAALAEIGRLQGAKPSLAELKALAATTRVDASPLPTVTETASRVLGTDWQQVAIDRISRWAAGYFDEGQTSWRSPWRGLPAYSAWREEAKIDRTPDVLGLRGFRAAVTDLPDEAEETIRLSVARLGIERPALELWFHRQLMSIGGWAGYVRYRLWQSELRGLQDRTMTELLAIRLAWEVLLHRLLAGNSAFDTAWSEARAAINKAARPAASELPDVLLQRACEHSWQRRFLAALAAATPLVSAARPAVQAAFCMDVRSEPLRRTLETCTPMVHTIGFAGFFGMPVEYVRLGHEHGTAQCPVLLRPNHIVCESAGTEEDGEHDQLHDTSRSARLLRRGWYSFKSAAVASFGYVESVGWSYAVRLLSDTLGMTRPQVAAAAAAPPTRPLIAMRQQGGRRTGMSLEARVELGENLLRSLSTTRDFARLFLLTAHGSSSVNNPYASSLDCGACGGHTGEANARIAAAILNDAEVRAALAERGIGIPASTWFIAALHDTTQDTVSLFDESLVPASHADDLQRLRDWLQLASQQARLERARRLADIGLLRAHEDLRGRSRDWSQMRPELGLAGCAGFLAAPRARTRGVDLEGRIFLHDYDWRSDEGFRTLEQIMTAPMVVAAWISLQYYGSTVDNEHLGSGNKALHNVVGALGVCEGNGGDLRVGLPTQSLFAGERLLHEPLRLSVFIDAPLYAIEMVLNKHESVWQLIGNRWIHLFAFRQDDGAPLSYVPSQGWQAASSSTAVAPAVQETAKS